MRPNNYICRSKFRMEKALVIIPTLNEIENISNIVNAVFALGKGYHILVVDDNSKDGTPECVEKLMTDYKGQLFLEKRTGAKGLGLAYIHGFKWALKRDYEYILEMDADFSHNPNDLPKLITACENGADMSVGSRYVNDKVNVINWSMRRLLLSYFASKYVRWVTGLAIYDTTAGFVCYRKKVLESINLDSIRFVGYAFQIAMKYRASELGFKIKEVSIVFTDRTAGKSKMSSNIVREGILGVIQLRFSKNK